ncbi:MAG: sigma-70 family RNA polymerase sigma factor [Clostridia bacterium]|nr:sigma-70 family RNA polymerase sigma factor [Clostridia bacterium]
MDDANIIALFRAGNEEAIAACERKYGAACRRMAENILGSAEDAEECVSDVWLRAWTLIPEHPPRKLGVFLTTVTRNLALDRLRASRRDKRGGGEADLCLDELADSLPSGEVPPEYELALRDIMTRFVQSLGEEERLLFLLRYRNMEPVEAIARRLHKSPGAVKTALFRCREKLRKALKKEGIDV